MAPEHHGRGHAFKAERANEGRRLPVHEAPVLGNARPVAPGRNAGPSWSSAGLVNEHQPLGLQIGLGVEPGLASSLLLENVMPCRSSSRQTRGGQRSNGSRI